MKFVLRYKATSLMLTKMEYKCERIVNCKAMEVDYNKV